MTRRLLVLVLVASCDGANSGNEGSECRSSAACDPGLECAGPNGGPVCGIPPQEGCATDNDCPPGGNDRCHAIYDSCSSDYLGSECRPACTGDPDCGGPDFHCDNGACVAVLCNAGFTCADREVCDPSRIPANAPVHMKHHGCFSVACTDDAACNGKTCVNGYCQDGIGFCREPQLVP